MASDYKSELPSLMLFFQHEANMSAMCMSVFIIKKPQVFIAIVSMWTCIMLAEGSNANLFTTETWVRFVLYP